MMLKVISGAGHSRTKPLDIVESYQRVYEVAKVFGRYAALMAFAILLINAAYSVFDSEEALRPIEVGWAAFAIVCLGLLGFIFTLGEKNKWLRRGWYLLFGIIAIVVVIRVWEVGIGRNVETSEKTSSSPTGGMKHFWKDLFSSSSGTPHQNDVSVLVANTSEYLVVPGMPGMRTSWNPLDPNTCIAVKVNNGQAQIVCVNNNKPQVWPENGNRTVQQATTVDGPLYSFSFKSLTGKPEKIVISRGLP